MGVSNPGASFVIAEAIAAAEEAEAAAAVAKAEREGAKVQKEAAESARATAEAEANSAVAAAKEAEEGGYPAGKEAAEVVVVPATEPTVGAEKSVAFGAPGIVHSIQAVFVGDGEKLTWKIKHELNTYVTSTTFHSEAGEKAGVQTLVHESKAISANEIEVVLETAPAAEETFWLVVQG